MASRTVYSTWTPQKPTLFDGHYLRNRSTLDIGVLGYSGIVQHEEHSPEILSIPPGTPFITSSQNTTKFIALCCTICYTTTCLGPFLRPSSGCICLYLTITLKAKQIQPEDYLKKGRNM